MEQWFSMLKLHIQSSCHQWHACQWHPQQNHVLSIHIDCPCFVYHFHTLHHHQNLIIKSCTSNSYRKCPKTPNFPKSHHLWFQLLFQSHSHVVQAISMPYMCIICQKFKMTTDTRVSGIFIKLAIWLHGCIALIMYIICLNYTIIKFP